MMKIRLICVGQLASFIREKSFLDAPELPITPERALSQQLNPLADPDDPALLLAQDEDGQLLGYLGILPLGKTAQGTKLYGTSCWWVHPERGQGTGMPLFYKMLQLTGGNLLFFDLTPITASLLESMPQFESLPERHGEYLWFRSGFFLTIGKRNRGWMQLFKVPAAGLDYFFNVFINLRLLGWRKRNCGINASITLELLDAVDPVAATFLEDYSRLHFLARTRNELEWIRSGSWLVPGKIPVRHSGRYAFSWRVQEYRTELCKLSDHSGIIALAFLSWRDGVCRLPFVYCMEEHGTAVSLKLLQHISSSGGHGILGWQPALQEVLRSTRFPVLWRRKVFKRVAYGSRLKPEIPVSWYPQDGDGDGIFT